METITRQVQTNSQQQKIISFYRRSAKTKRQVERYVEQQREEPHGVKINRPIECLK